MLETNEQYVYELEKALGDMLAFFDPTGPTYQVETTTEELAEINEDLAAAVDRANEVLYGEGYGD